MLLIKLLSEFVESVKSLQGVYWRGNRNEEWFEWDMFAGVFRFHVFVREEMGVVATKDGQRVVCGCEETKSVGHRTSNATRSALGVFPVRDDE